MDSRFRWICIAFLLFFFLGGPSRVLGFLGAIGLVPSVTQEQVLTEMQRVRQHDWMTCKPASPEAEWDYVCEYGSGDQRVSRDGVKTSKGWGRAVARVIPLPERDVLTEADATKWRQDEQMKQAGPINIRTASISDLQRIPRVDHYRAQEIHAAVRAGLVRDFDDLLKIQGIDQPTLNAMRTRAYWK